MGICFVKGGKRIPVGRQLTKEATSQKYIRVSDMQEGTVITESLLYVPEDIIPMISKYTISSEDVYITVAGTIGRVGLIPDDISGANLTENADKLVFSHLNKKWLIAMLESPFLQEQITACTTQVGQPKLAIKRIESFLIPLPPQSEQSRIANAIDSVVSLIAQYSTLETAREELDAELPNRLRKSILQMAVQGKLVPQDANDESASALLERIRERRRHLMAEGKIKAPKGGESVIYRGSDGGYYEKRIDAKGCESEPVCINDEIPFEIPDSWEWSRLGSLASFGGGGTPDKNNPKYWSGNIPWASMKDIHGQYLESTIDSITPEGLRSKKSISICNPGQLIVSTRLIPGKTIISKIKCAINQDLKVVNSLLSSSYLSVWFESYSDRFKQLGMGTTVPGIKLIDLESALIPLPPEYEQNRIISKLNNLFQIIH